MFAIAAETGWPEDRILFMPLARLAQYQHCLLRRNGVRTHWCGLGSDSDLAEQIAKLRLKWTDSIGHSTDISMPIGILQPNPESSMSLT